MPTKYELMQALFTGGPLTDKIRGLRFRIVNAVEREDGSGHNFNVTGTDDATGQTVTRFVKTVD